MDQADPRSELEQKASKSRTPHKAGLVRAVLAQDGTDEEKIQRIVLIDLLPDPPAGAGRSKGVLLRPTKPEPGAEIPAEPELTPRPTPEQTRQAADEARRTLYRPRPRAHWWTYFTKELTAIRKMGVDTGILIAHWIPFTFRVSPEADRWLRTQLSDRVASFLEPHLPAVLGRSWATLSKREYNLLVALADVIRWWKTVTLPPAGSSMGFWAHALLPGLHKVLLFSTDPRLIDQTITAWNLAVEGTVPSKQRTPEGPQVIEALLRATGLRVSLPDVLQAVVSVRQRRFLRWTDLAENTGPFLWEDGFEASAEVQQAIDQVIDQTRTQAEALEKQLWENRRLRYFLPGNEVLDALDHGMGRDDREAWSRLFLAWARESAAPFLVGEFSLADGRRLELPEDPTIVSLIQRLAELEAPVPEGTPGPEALDVARVALTLGKAVASVVRRKTRLTPPWVHDWDEPAGDALVGEDQVVDDPLFWAGQTVGHSLVQAGQICFAAGRLLGDASMEPLIAQHEPTRSRARDVLKTLERLAPRDLWEDWKRRIEEASGDPG